jgi:hypothetical protein
MSMSTRERLSTRPTIPNSDLIVVGTFAAVGLAISLGFAVLALSGESTAIALLAQFAGS